MDFDSGSLTDLVTAGGILFSAVIGLGVVISRFTKTPKDDAFFDRLAGIFKKQS